MLIPEAVKPLLLHEDAHVRRAAIGYFDESFSSDPEVLPLILESWDRYGHRQDLAWRSAWQRVALNEHGLEAVLAFLSRAADDDLAGALRRIVAGASPNLLAANLSALLGCEALAPVASEIRARAGLAAVPSDDLWRKLQHFSHEYDEAEVDELPDLGEGDELTEALGERDVPDVATICRLLDAPEREGTTLEYFLIDLAGYRRLREAVPVLVDKLAVEPEKVVIEGPMDALARIGDPEAVRLLRLGFEAAPLHQRAARAEILPNIKCQESEDAILSVLETEKDEEVRWSLCTGLCRLFSRPGVDLVAREIDRTYGSERADLISDLLPVIDALAIEHPDAAKWRRRRKGREKGIGATLDRGAWERVEENVTAEKVEEPHLGANRRPEAKVGRNDPCPCGSGRKYKKCCGRKR